MPSPFPGMNPYLEQPDAWHSFHESFCPALVEAIVPQVRPRYIVKIDEHVYLHELSAEERLSFVRILDRETREVVTVIDLLSPSNKDSEEDRSQYLGKRERVLESPAHLVELDLLRGGNDLRSTISRSAITA